MIYLRKTTTKEELWNALQADTKEFVKSKLLEHLQTETDKTMRSQISDTISDLSSIIASRGEWPDLLDHLIEGIKTGNDDLKESCLLILGQLCSTNIPLMKPYMPGIRDLCASCLNSTSASVRLAVIVSMTGFISATKSKAQRPLFQELIPNILQLIGRSIVENQLEQATSIVHILVDWAELDPIFFKPFLQEVVDCMLEVCTSCTDESTVFLAALFLSQMTASANTVKYLLKLDNFVPKFFNVLMTLLTQIKDIPLEEWDENNSLMELCLGEKIEACVDKLSLSLGGKILMPHIFEPIQRLIQSSEWTHVHAAIMALSLIAEGSKKQFIQNVHDIVSLILPHLSHPHPRIRWVACHAIGSLAHDLSPKIQQQFDRVIIPEIAKLLDEKYTTIIATALTSLSTFCESVEQNHLVEYLDDILKKLYNLLGSSDDRILGETITALASVSSRAMQYFTPYYDTFIPYLKHILEHTHSAEHRILRGKVFECISIFGIAVGKEKFKGDADVIMTQLSLSDAGDYGKDESNYEFLLEASARICGVLKEDFIPYLPMILPTILKTASMDPEHYMKEVDDLHDEDDYQYHLVGDKKIGLHTTALELKASACQILYCFIDVLRDNLAPYFGEIRNVLTPLLSFVFHKGIRATSLSIARKFIKSVSLYSQKNGTPQDFFSIFDDVYNQLIDALLDESELEIQNMMCEAVADLIEMLPQNALSREFAYRAVNAIVTTAKEIEEARIDQYQLLDDEIDEEFYLDQLQEREDEEYGVLGQLAEIAGIMARTQLESYTPFFMERLEFIFSLIKSNNTAGNKYLGFCMIDDMMENSKGAIKEYVQYFAKEMIESILDPHPGVRHAAIYGIGVCAQRCGDLFAQYTEGMLYVSSFRSIRIASFKLHDFVNLLTNPIL